MNINLLAIFTAWYLSLSLATFLLYARDKAAARRQARRTPEKTLHLLALLGGWPGAWCAQRWLRHKSSKPSFRRVFWLTLLINLAVPAYLLSPYGAGTLEFVHVLARQAAHLWQMPGLCGGGSPLAAMCV
jgi:uncharacterized membrane protein YsdA (DUF1294 family)